MNIARTGFYSCLFIAILLTRCDGDDTRPSAVFINPLANPQDGPPAGNPDGNSPVPPEAGPEDISNPDIIIGNGTPESCTGDAFIKAVAKGGKIVFNCGPEPVTITLNKPAKVFNDANPDIVIDGNGLITLSGGGKNRILYMNTCDQNQHWTTSHCQDQETPRLTVQNITFTDGNSRSETEYDGEVQSGPEEGVSRLSIAGFSIIPVTVSDLIQGVQQSEYSVNIIIFLCIL